MDPTTYVEIWSWYAKDKNNVYFNWEWVEMADPANFYVTWSWYGQGGWYFIGTKFYDYSNPPIEWEHHH